MNPDPNLFPPQAKNPFIKALGFLAGAILLVLAFMFSIVALAVIAVGAVIFGGWLWWKTRALRQAIREAQIAAQAAAQAESRSRSASEHAEPRAEDIIEGEFVRETTASQTPKLDESAPNRVERD
jgi:flagellar biosynthesis component FlhA